MEDTRVRTRKVSVAPCRTHPRSFCFPNVSPYHEQVNKQTRAQRPFTYLCCTAAVSTNRVYIQHHRNAPNAEKQEADPCFC